MLYLVWISQSWSPPFSCSGWHCSSTLQNNEIRQKMFCCFWSNTLEFTPIVCSWSITDTDSVLCMSEDCVILQSIRNTSIAPTDSLGCKDCCTNTDSLTYLLTICRADWQKLKENLSAQRSHWSRKKKMSRNIERYDDVWLWTVAFYARVR